MSMKVHLKKMKKEFINELQRRSKWKTEQQNNLLLPTEWHLGRIINIVYGNDKIFTTIRMPRCQLCFVNHPVKYFRVFMNGTPVKRKCSCLHFSIYFCANLKIAVENETKSTIHFLLSIL
ncbi:uncharacterized protein LOC124419005 [Lucilia cuprina]|uniref:uncharacterized protein LOC124419005 n=1 Tax=Lucilia cuprina TaxID=7375 RepID=UPI001F070E62|nr:uncharacterized protein LOC124419005 [Lucilia cuprina]